MKTLYLIRGVSGSGKTTLARSLTPYTASADSFFEDDNGNYNFDPTRLGEAHAWCQERVEELMKASPDIAVHNTLTSEKELAPYLRLAEKYGYRVVSLVVENRHGNGSVHNVPEHALERQESRLRNSLKLR